MFAEDISEDFSEDRRYHFYWILEYFWISSRKIVEDCFHLRSFRKFLSFGFLPLSRFQNIGGSVEKLMQKPWAVFSLYRRAGIDAALGGGSNLRKLEGGGDMYTREIGTMCQIGALTGKPCTFLGDRQPRTTPTKDLPYQVVFLGGGVRIVGT